MAVGFLTPQGKDLVRGARDISFSHCTRDSVPIPWDHQKQLVRQRASSILSFSLLQTWPEMDVHSPPPPGRTSCSPTDYASFWHFCCCWTERIPEYQTKGIESASSPESLKSLPWGTWPWFMCGHGASSEQGSQTLYFSLNIYLFMAASVLLAACVIFRRGARAQ